jgi:hypothetical protein
LKIIINSKRGRGISCTPSKDFEKLDHKNAMKHENQGTPPAPPKIFSKPLVPKKI